MSIFGIAIPVTLLLAGGLLGLVLRAVRRGRFRLDGRAILRDARDLIRSGIRVASR